MLNSRKLGLGLLIGIFCPLFSLHSSALTSGYKTENGLEVGSKDAPILYTAKQLNTYQLQQKTNLTGRAFEKTSSAASTQNNGPQLSWGMYSFGSGIGASGFYLADLDEDGQQELIAGGGQGFGGNIFINILKKSTKNYIISRQLSLPGNAGIRNILGLHNEVTDNHELYVSDSNGYIHQFNLTAGRFVSTFPATGNSTISLLRGDVDGDQIDELIAIGDNTTLAYDLLTHELKYTYAFGDSEAAYGHFSSSTHNELALRNGKVYRLQGDSSSLIWDYSPGFGANILASDANGDGLDEIVGAESWYKLRVFDVKNQAMLWSKDSSLDIATIAAFDTNNDGINEIIYGDGQWGSLHILNPGTGEEISSINNPEHGITNILVNDIDQDNELEIIWGAGHTSTGPDHLYISDLNSKTNEWTSSDISGPFHAIKIADVDNDKKMEILAISNTSNSGYGDGILYIFDAITRELKWSSEGINLFGGHAWTGIRGLDVGDVSNDGKNEIVIGTGKLYDGIIYVLDGETKALMYSKTYDSGSPISSVRISDIDRDGKNEIIAANTVAHTGSPGTMVYVLNGNDGAIIKRSSSLMFDWAGTKQMDVLDSTGDGVADIQVIVNNAAYTYDTTKSIFQQIGTLSYTAVAHGIIDTTQHVILGGADGWLSYFNSPNVVKLAKVCESSFTTLTNHSNTQVLFICESNFGLFDLSTNTIVWQQTTNIYPQAITSFKGTNLDQFLLGGSNVDLYENIGLVNNLLANDSTLTTSAKKSVDATLAASGKTDTGKFIITKAPLHGAVDFSNRQQGTFTFTPKGDFIGVDSFSFIVLETGSESNEATVNITITNANPVSASQTFSTSWRKALSASIIASDGDNDQLTFTILSQPGRGTLTLTDTKAGTFTYLPEGKSLEPVAFSYEVTDGIAKTGPISAAIGFTNNKPIAQGSNVNGWYNASSSGILKATDEDSDNLTYKVTENVSAGTLSVDAVTGLYTYQPVGEQTYTATFKFVANDGIADSEPQQVTIKVEGKPNSAVTENGGGGGGGSISLWLLFGLALSFFCRIKRS